MAGRSHGLFLFGFAYCPFRHFQARRRVRVRYRSSFFDDPVRPLIRFETADGRIIVHPMNGAVPGCGEWSGRIPNKTRGSINPPGRSSRTLRLCDRQRQEADSLLAVIAQIGEILGKSKNEHPADNNADARLPQLALAAYAPDRNVRGDRASHAPIGSRRRFFCLSYA